MHRWSLSVLFMAVVFTGVAAPRPAAAVNCDQVRRYLQTGRSVEDVAESMVVSVEDVKKCQSGATEQKNEPKPAPTPGAGKAGS